MKRYQKDLLFQGIPNEKRSVFSKEYRIPMEIYARQGGKFPLK